MQTTEKFTDGDYAPSQEVDRAMAVRYERYWGNQILWEYQNWYYTAAAGCTKRITSKRDENKLNSIQFNSNSLFPIITQ